MLRFKTVTALALVGLLLACSRSKEDDDTGDGNGDGSGTGSAGSGTGTGSGPSTGSGKDAGADSATGSAGSNGTSDGGDDFDVNVETEACAQLSIGAQGKPAILVMVIDKSTSMNDTSNRSTGGASKWQATRDALVAAIPNLPRSLAVGELFFPNVSIQGVSPSGCEDANSLIVRPGPMSDDAQVQELVDAVNAVPVPTDLSGTPTYDAYAIGVQMVQAALAHPPAGFEDATGYVMLATDGMPTHSSDCGDAFGRGDGSRLAVSEAQWQEILDLAEDAAANEGINTFVVGVPGSEATNQVPCADANGDATHTCQGSNPALDYIPMSKLSELAVLGRTAVDGCTINGPRYCQIDLTQTDDLVTGLERAIGTIAQSIVSCEYHVPTQEEIQEQAGPNVFPDYDAVVVDLYANGSSTVTEQLRRSDDDCATGGWQYNEDKTLLTLCDATCGAIKTDPYAAIEINFGCVEPQ
ncbi:MAG: VWA domain-containing protein [Polyangiaceae bacterium]|nr:VWA domain-containing protein [Polyangiaceae bacterium]